MRWKNRIAGLAVAGLALSGTSAFAQGTATGLLNVQVSILAQCQITSVTDVNFGTQGVLTSNIDSNGAISVTCSDATSYEIGLGAGQFPGATVTTRRMSLGGDPTFLVSYQLFRDAARTQNWGESRGSDTVTGTGNGTPQSYTVYARIPPQASPPQGGYADQVAITVFY